MMRSSLFAGLAFAATAALAAPASADCILQIEPAYDTWRIEHDPFEDGAALQVFDIAFVNAGDSPCAGSVQTDLRGAPYGLIQSGQADPIAYVVTDEQSGADLTPRTGQSQRRLAARPLDVAPGQRELRRFSVLAAPGDLPTAGLYSQPVFFTVLDPTGLPIAQKSVTVALDIAASAVMGLKGEFSRTSDGAVIRLGELTPGPRDLAVELYVLSTRGYQISVTSENQGRLRMGKTDWYIDYGLRLGGETLNLTSGDEVRVMNARRNRDSYPLGLSVGSVTGARAGDYSDTITFVIAAI